MLLPKWLRITGQQITVVQTFGALMYNRRIFAGKTCDCHTINILRFYLFLANILLCRASKHILYYSFFMEYDLHFTI